MEKVIWSLDMEKAVPIGNIKEYSIVDTSSYAHKDEFKKYAVLAAYTICTGSHIYVFTADSKEECIEWINNITDTAESKQTNLYIAYFTQYLTLVGQYAKGVLAEVTPDGMYGEHLRDITDAIYEFKFFANKNEAEEYLREYCGSDWEDLTSI